MASPGFLYWSTADCCLFWKCWCEQKDLELQTGWRILSVTLLIFVLWLAYGNQSLKRYSSLETNNEKIKIALVQGNVEQFMKWNPVYQNIVINKYRDLTLKAAEKKPDLIIWPETATPFYFDENQSETDSMRDLAREIKIPILFGSPHREKIKDEIIYFNSAYLLSESGETLGRYDKNTPRTVWRVCSFPKNIILHRETGGNDR